MKQVVLPIDAELLDEGGFFVRCPLLKGCHAQGASLPEALSNLQDAAELVLAYMQERGLPLPPELREAPLGLLHEELLVNVAS
jgi:predicted RNase H-like HicB family nuclease